MRDIENSYLTWDTFVDITEKEMLFERKTNHILIFALEKTKTFFRVISLRSEDYNE